MCVLWHGGKSSNASGISSKWPGLLSDHSFIWEAIAIAIASNKDMIFSTHRTQQHFQMLS